MHSEGGQTDHHPEIKDPPSEDGGFTVIDSLKKEEDQAKLAWDRSAVSIPTR